MRSRHRPAAIRAALTRVELDADTRGWDALPTLLGLFDATVHRHDPRITVDAFGIDPGF